MMMGFKKKPKLYEYNVRLAHNGYVIRANYVEGADWTAVDYVARDFDELVGVITQLEVESGK
jgi:hypothetical protein